MQYKVSIRRENGRIVAVAHVTITEVDGKFWCHVDPVPEENPEFEDRIRRVIGYFRDIKNEEKDRSAFLWNYPYNSPEEAINAGTVNALQTVGLLPVVERTKP